MHLTFKLLSTLLGILELFSKVICSVVSCIGFLAKRGDFCFNFIHAAGWFHLFQMCEL
jgi:hypothetical protein